MRNRRHIRRPQRQRISVAEYLELSHYVRVLRISPRQLLRLVGRLPAHSA